MYFGSISPQLLRPNFGRFVGHVARALAAGGGGNTPMNTLAADLEGFVFAARAAAHEHKLPKSVVSPSPSLLAISRSRFVQRLASDRGGGGQIPVVISCLRSLSGSCAKGAVWKQLWARP